VTGAGSLFIQETDAITLLDVDTADWRHHDFRWGNHHGDECKIHQLR
jgi:hypothetical protein